MISVPNTVGMPDRPRRLGEAHHAVEAVVIGERERVETEPGRLHRQLLGCEAPSRKEKFEWQCSSA